MDIRLEHKKILFQIDQGLEENARREAGRYNSRTYYSSSSGSNGAGISSEKQWSINAVFAVLTIPLGFLMGIALAYHTAIYWWSCISN